MSFEIDTDKLRELLSDYMEQANEVEALEGNLKVLKAAMTDLLHEYGIVHHVVPGLGNMKITPPGERESYDSAKLDALVMELIDQNTDVTDAFARKLRNCKKITRVSSFLRIEKEGKEFKPNAKRP